MWKDPGARQSTAFKDLEELCVLEGDKAEDQSTPTGFLTALKHLNAIPGGPWELRTEWEGVTYPTLTLRRKKELRRGCVSWSRPCPRRWGGGEWESVCLGPWLLL